MANSNRHEIIDLTGESTAPVPKPHPRSTAAKKGATKTDPITVDLEDEEPAETPSRAQPTVNLPTRSLSGSAPSSLTKGKDPKLEMQSTNRVFHQITKLGLVVNVFLKIHCLLLKQGRQSLPEA